MSRPMNRRPFTPKIITANDLIEGDVVYWSCDNAWVRRHGGAAYFDTEDRAQAALDRAASQIDIAVGVVLVDAVMGDAGPEPVHFREAFRAAGPSNYFHGKQTETASPGSEQAAPVDGPVDGPAGGHAAGGHATRSAA